MKVFGMKQREPTDEDRAAAARLSAVAARFRGDQSTNLTESSPDPLGAPRATEEPEKREEWQPSGIAEPSPAPDASDAKQESDAGE